MPIISARGSPRSPTRGAITRRCPGVVAIGSSAEAREQAPAARVTLLSPGAKIATLGRRDPRGREAAARDRDAVVDHARRAEAAADRERERSVAGDAAARAQRRHRDRARRAALARPALRDADARCSISCATSGSSSCPSSRRSRTPTARRPCRRSSRPGRSIRCKTARLLWALASLGAIELTPEVRDVGDAGAALARRDPQAPARARRAARALDVLRRPRDHAARRVSRDRGVVSAARLALLAAGARSATTSRELVTHVKPTWELVEKARTVLVDRRAARPLHRLAAPEPRDDEDAVGDRYRATRSARPRRSRAARRRSAKATRTGDERTSRRRAAITPAIPTTRRPSRGCAIACRSRRGKDQVEHARAERARRRGLSARLPAVAARARRARAAVRGGRRCRLGALAPRDRAVDRSERSRCRAARAAARIAAMKWLFVIALAALSKRMRRSSTRRPASSSSSMRRTRDDVAPIIAKEVARATHDHKKLLVYLGATWCEPCVKFHEAAARGPARSGDFGDVRMLVFDADRDNEALERAGLQVRRSCRCSRCPAPTAARSAARSKARSKARTTSSKSRRACAH